MKFLLRRLLWTAALPAAFAVQAAPQGGMQAVTEVKAVRLEKPASFWRNGKEESAREAVLIRVKVRDPFEFMQRGITPPLFVLDGAVCRMIQSPFPGGEAVLLGSAAKGAGELLMTDSGPTAPFVTEANLRSMKGRFSRAEMKVRSLKVKAPAAAAPVASYKDVDDLRRDVLRKGR
jgi:hypothetical protein